jgi:hypothetical protein
MRLGTYLNIISHRTAGYFYGYETQSHTLREEHKLRVLENRVLRLFGPKREEVAGGWRRLHNEELCNLHTSPSNIRMIRFWRMRWIGHAAHMGDDKCIQNFGQNTQTEETICKTYV